MNPIDLVLAELDLRALVVEGVRVGIRDAIAEVVRAQAVERLTDKRQLRPAVNTSSALESLIAALDAAQKED